MRPRCSVTLVASKQHWRSSVNMFLWFSGLKLPSFELVGDRGGHPPYFPSDHFGELFGELSSTEVKINISLLGAAHIASLHSYLNFNFRTLL